MTRPLVDVDWLHENLGRDNVVVIDASWYLPNMKRDGYAEYLESHIPGAVYFPIDEIADKTSNLPHMLPSADEFSSAVGALGIADNDTIVVYDAVGLSSSARVWWTFRVFGAKNVFILGGGLPAWRDAGFDTESGTVSRPVRAFNASLDTLAVSDHAAVQQALDTGERQVLDARSAERFAGSAPEPRPELSSGHMPGALNLPFQELIGTGGKLLDNAKLKRTLESAGVDMRKPVTTTCGSGVTAAILTLALESIGHDDLSLYDGSWTDWASREDSSIIKDAS